MVTNPFEQADVASGQETKVNPFEQADAASANKQGEASTSPVEKQSAFMDALAVMNRNFATVANGQLQAAAQGLAYLGIDTSGFQKKIENFQNENEQAYREGMKNSPIAGTIADIGSSIGAAVATPGGQPFLASSLGAGIGERVIGAGLASGVAGGSQYIPEGSGQNRLGNAIESGILGTALQGGGEAIGKGIQAGAKSLFANSLGEAAKIADGAAYGDAGQTILGGGRTIPSPTDLNVVAPTVGMVTGNKAIQGAETALSSIPIVGTKGALAERAGQIEGATRGVLDELGVGTKTKVELGDALAQDLKQSYSKATANTNAAYNKALSIASDEGLAVPLSTAQNTAANAINDIQNLSKAGVSSSTVNSKAGTLLTDIANIPDNQIPATMFDTLRKKVNSTISTLAKGGDDEALLPAFKQIRSDMDTDLNSLGNVNSKFGDALKNARATYLTQKLPFQENNVLAKAVGGNVDVDSLLDQAVKANRPIFTGKIMDQLSPDGKKAFSAAIVQKAYKNSITEEGSNISLDLHKFSTNLSRLGETLDALPKNEQLKIKGLQTLLTRSDYLLKAANKPINTLFAGALGGAGLGAGATSQLPAFLASAAGAKLVSKALTSPTLARNLVRLAGGKLGTKATDGVTISTLKKLLGASGAEGAIMGVKAGTIPSAATAISND